MRKIYFGFGFVLTALMFMSLNTMAQPRYVDVLPGIGTLNDAINGDTTDTGDRIDPEITIYRLERGEQAYYGLTGSIENSGFPLTIMAAEGDGPRPFLQPRVVGGESARPFRPRGNITLSGLHVTGQDDLGGMTTRLLRCSANDIKVTINDCWFDKDGQSFIRCDNAGMTFKISNTVISNIGSPKSPDNGRGIDDRGNAIDTVIFDNCTFYNITSRIIRDDGGVLGYAQFTNNTFMNVGQHGITFGPTGAAMLVNNLFVNFGFMPTDARDPNYVFSIDSVGGVPPTIIASNNNVYLDSTKVEGYLNDTLMMPVVANATFMGYLLSSGAIATMLNEPVEFTNGPPFNDSIILYDIDPNLDQNNAPEWAEPEIPGDGLYHRDVPYDFGWVNSKLYVAGVNLMTQSMGIPLGDMNWETDRGVMGVVDFENPRDRIFWSVFANAGDDPMTLNLTLNPDMSAANPSPFVLQMMVQDAADPWAGAYTDAVGYISPTEEMHYIQMMVHKDVISDVAVKLEQGTADAVESPHVANTVTGEWELLMFDLSAAIGETFTRLTLFPDFSDPRTAGSTAYMDNIQLVAGPSNVKELKDNKVRVYPNPVTDQMTIEYPLMSRIVVRDILGKAVRTVDLQRMDRVTLEMNDLVEGVYFL
ncbi:MAG: T9SS type A sorting domain-containing protein, partial [Bacteroidales bacterium]